MTCVHVSLRKERRDGKVKALCSASTLDLLIMSIELRTGGKRKIMPFIETSLVQSASASPKATTLHVYNMSLFLSVACLFNRCQKGKQCKVSIKKDQRD